MLLSDYSFASLCLIAALALLIALLLRLADKKLQLLSAIPSPLEAWRSGCTNFAHRLNRKERSSGALRIRGRILLFMVLLIAFLFGFFCEKVFDRLQNDYLETLLLSLVFLALPKASSSSKDDDASQFRHEIESDGIRLLHDILAPLTGWVILGWSGVFMIISIIALRNAVMSIQTGFDFSIRRAAKLFLFPASLLGIGIISFASLFISKGKPLPALRLGFEKMLMPHTAIIATVSEAMHVSLGGPSSYYLDLLGRDWLGNGIARLQKPDIKRWNWLLSLSHYSLIVLLIALALLL